MNQMPDSKSNNVQVGLNNEMIRSLVNHIPGAVYRCRGDAFISLEFFSDEIENLTGYSVDYFLQNRQDGYSQLVFAEDRDRIEKLIREAITKKIKYETEYRIVDKKGQLKWVFETGKGCYDKAENIVFIAGCIFDITHRKQTEASLAIETDIIQRKQTLTEQEELVQRLTLASNSAAIGIFEIDFVNKQVIWDDRMYQIYGITKEAGLDLFSIYNKALHPDDQAMMAKIIEDFFAKKIEINGTVYRIILPIGSIRYIESHAIIKKSESGHILSLIGTNRDITTEVLVQEKIKSQNKVLRDIAFIQSHEVRRPLANILGVLEILQNSGAIKDLELFDLLIESANELDTQIKGIVSKANEMDDDVFR